MTTVTYQPDVADSFMQQANPTTNYGSLTYIGIYNYPEYLWRAILAFSIAGLPAGAVITAATLSLYYYGYSGNDPSGSKVWAYKLNNTLWAESTVTWVIYRTGSNWTSPGGDYVTSSPSGGSTTFPANYGWMNWNILAIVQDAYAQSIAVELLMRFDNEGLANNIPYWYSREYAVDTSLRPKLVIEYVLAGRSYGLIIG